LTPFLLEDARVICIGHLQRSQLRHEPSTRQRTVQACFTGAVPRDSRRGTHKRVADFEFYANGRHLMLQSWSVLVLPSVMKTTVGISERLAVVEREREGQSKKSGATKGRQLTDLTEGRVAGVTYEAC
jgi:hypothetical protein